MGSSRERDSMKSVLRRKIGVGRLRKKSRNKKGREGERGKEREKLKGKGRGGKKVRNKKWERGRRERTSRVREHWRGLEVTGCQEGREEEIDEEREEEEEREEREGLMSQERKEEGKESC